MALAVHYRAACCGGFPAGWGSWVFCCIFGRVCHLSCRRSGDPSGRGHVVVPRGRARSVLPARASLAHSDPLVSSSIAFCWALHRARRSWGRYSKSVQNTTSYHTSLLRVTLLTVYIAPLSRRGSTRSRSIHEHNIVLVSLLPPPTLQLGPSAWNTTYPTATG